MNYEEYASRMQAQKRRPVEREHYEEIVEKAYMALGEVDKDEFCGLSDKTIGAIRRLAETVENAKAAAKEAEARAKYAEANEKAAKDRESETDKKFVGLCAEVERLNAECGKRDAIIEKLLASMTADATRRFLLANV